MKKIKTFSTVINVSNDDDVNKFLENHNAISIDTYISQGFTYSNSFVEQGIKPLLITRIIYDDELKRG